MIKAKAKGETEVVLKAYQDDPVSIQLFDPWQGLYAVPLENPTTHGPSKSVICQTFKPFVRTANQAVRYLRAEMGLSHH